jgi:hypothetical protein
MPFFCSACSGYGDRADRPLAPDISDGADAWRIRVIDPSGTEAYSFIETELKSAWENAGAFPAGAPGLFAHAYSTINNWPANRFYAAEGYTVASILSLAGFYESAQTVTFRGEDGYEVSLTREQLLSPRYAYPHVGESEDGAEPVYALIAYRWKEGADDLGSIREGKPSLIFGQENPYEHTNPAFVIGVAEIIVSDAPCDAWPAPSTFPMPGLIASGETVKMQHPDYGLVKIYYTLDGSEPTARSPMYNPSTYQPELNKPIPIVKPTVIKAFAYGYGKADSEAAAFAFVPN